MAVVRLSKTLRAEIIDNADVIFSMQVRAAEAARPSPSWGDAIYEKLFGHLDSVFTSVPQEFLNMHKSVYVGKVKDQLCNLKFDFSIPRPWPVVFATSEFAAQTGGYSTTINLADNPAWDELYVEVKHWNDEIRKALQKRDELVAQVKKVVYAYPTLARVLKVWPGVWNLVPERYKDVHRKATKVYKKLALDVDFDALTAVMALNKLTQ